MTRSYCGTSKGIPSQAATGLATFDYASTINIALAEKKNLLCAPGAERNALIKTFFFFSSRVSNDWELALFAVSRGDYFKFFGGKIFILYPRWYGIIKSTLRAVAIVIE